MAVTGVKEEFRQRRARETFRGLTATRVFQVETNDKADDALVVLASGSLPAVGSTHPTNSTLFCVDRDAFPKVEDTATFWTVVCNYTNENEYSENPLLQPPRFTWTTEKFQVVARKDRNGKGIVNSAGDPFDPPAMKDLNRRIVVMRRNVASVPSWLLDYEDAVNSDAFTIDGFAVGVEKAKCDKVNIGESRTRGGIEFREIVLEIHLSRIGWNLELLDEGFNYLNNDDPRKKLPILDKDEDGNEIEGQKVTAPVLLDGNGGILANPSVDTAVFKEFEVSRLLPFSALPLGSV